MCSYDHTWRRHCCFGDVGGCCWGIISVGDHSQLFSLGRRPRTSANAQCAMAAVSDGKRSSNSSGAALSRVKITNDLAVRIAHTVSGEDIFSDRASDAAAVGTHSVNEGSGLGQRPKVKLPAGTQRLHAMARLRSNSSRQDPSLEPLRRVLSTRKPLPEGVTSRVDDDGDGSDSSVDGGDRASDARAGVSTTKTVRRSAWRRLLTFPTVVIAIWPSFSRDLEAEYLSYSMAGASGALIRACVFLAVQSLGEIIVVSMTYAMRDSLASPNTDEASPASEHLPLEAAAGKPSRGIAAL